MNLWLKNISLCLDELALCRLACTVDQPFFASFERNGYGPSLPVEKIEETGQSLNTDSKTAPDDISSPLSQAHLDQPLL